MFEENIEIGVVLEITVELDDIGVAELLVDLNLS